MGKKSTLHDKEPQINQTQDAFVKSILNATLFCVIAAV